MQNSTTASINETKIVMSDPTALGVFGLAMVTFVAASQKMGWTSGSVYLIPWALFLGSIAQVWASSIDFKKNNYFGAIVLGAYGLFWIAVAMHWAISLGWLGAVGDKADPRQLGVACIGYFIFSLFIAASARRHGGGDAAEHAGDARGAFRRADDRRVLNTLNTRLDAAIDRLHARPRRAPRC
jgi:succinate-acetate transporter protein